MTEPGQCLLGSSLDCPAPQPTNLRAAFWFSGHFPRWCAFAFVFILGFQVDFVASSVFQGQKGIPHCSLTVKFATETFGCLPGLQIWAA